MMETYKWIFIIIVVTGLSIALGYYWRDLSDSKGGPIPHIPFRPDNGPSSKLPPPPEPSQPLTAELLKKNGFKLFSESFVLDIPDTERWKDCEVWVDLNHQSVYIGRHDKTGAPSWSGEGIHLNRITDTRQLQTILQLFGIDKEIRP